MGTYMRIAAGLMLAALVASCATPAPSAPAPAATQTGAAPKTAAPKTAPAAKTAAAPAAGKALVKEAGDKRVCRRQTEIGSNFPKRVCKSATEWAAYDKANLEGVEQYKRDSQQNTASSPMAQ